jgi:hypothetical protein
MWTQVDLPDYTILEHNYILDKVSCTVIMFKFHQMCAKRYAESVDWFHLLQQVQIFLQTLQAQTRTTQEFTSLSFAQLFLPQ